MSEISRYINRELSWLEFNQRVLDEALDPAVPLLERLFFLAVTASNLDEFFMLRISGLKLLVEGGVTRPDRAGLTPHEQLQQVLARIRRMYADQYECLDRELLPALAAAGVRLKQREELDAAQAEFADAYVAEEAASVLTPVALDPEAPLPLLVSGALYLLFMLAPEESDSAAAAAAATIGSQCDASTGHPRFALLRLGNERLLRLPHAADKYDVVLSEDLLRASSVLFHGQQILASTCLRITRNADIPVREEYAAELATEMEAVLRNRRDSGCVRLEVSAGTCRELRECALKLAGVSEEMVFEIPGPLNLAALDTLCNWPSLAHLCYPPWPPQPNCMIDPTRNIFGEIAARDIVVSLPFESFDPVLQLLEQAGADPHVLAIKILLYRTANDSRVVQALARAAEQGKNVTAVIEIKARFDEATNIAWARELEAAGVQVVYGIRGYKTHAKACLVVRREAGGIVRYLHLSSGNYNEVTGRLYTDVGLLTCNPDMGRDIADFFNVITGYAEPQDYRLITQAPLNLRDRLLALIAEETRRARAGQPAWIRAKMNALIDYRLVDALYEASQAGVEIDLNVRGMCVLRPGLPGLSERIRVVSIIDRYLEHSRIFRFCHGGDELVFLSSADWMPRNLERRIELLIPIQDPACRDRLVQILETCLADNVKGRLMQGDGSYLRRPIAAGEQLLRSQEELYRLSCKAAKNNNRAAPEQLVLFEPHHSVRRKDNP